MPSGISPGGRPIDESPLSSSKDDNWVARAGGLPPYIRGIARGIAKKHGGAVTSKDIEMAVASVKKLAATSKNPAVKAAAAEAVAQWEALRGKAHADLAANGSEDILLDWASFDANRGTKGNQAAAQATGTIPGYTGPPLDAGTIAKIKAFQQENGLPVSGNLDSQTVTFAHNNMAKVAAGGSGGSSAGSKAASAATKAAAAADKAAAKKLALEERSAKIITAHKAAAEKKAAKAKVAAAKKVAAANKKAAAAKVTAAKKAAAAKAKADAAAAKVITTTKANLQSAITNLGTQAAALDKAGNHQGAEAMRVTIAQLNAKIASTK